MSKKLCAIFFGLSMLLSLAGIAGPAAAQVEPEVSALTVAPAAEATIARLQGLALLPAGRWRVHAGDLAHGEAPDLDDSGWAETALPYLATKDAIWFRRVIEVPKTREGYALAGAAISIEFNIWTPGPVPIIVYFDGRRVAMGEALEPIALFTRAKPGDRILVAVKALATPDVKHFDGVALRVRAASGRPDPNDLALEAVAARYLLPVLSRDVARDRAVLERALAKVDLAALAAGRQPRFDASVRAAETAIAALRPVIAPAGFHLTGNAHIDAAWTWPWTETVDVVRRTFSTALQLMREYPDYTYSQSVAGYYAWMAEKYPAIDAEIAGRVRDRRWEIVGGMWAEPDLNIIDGESIVRQLLLGKGLFRTRYGIDVKVGWNPDTFGYNWQLPQIYKKAGIDYFVTQKMDWNESNELPLKLFYWQSPDGSRVLTYFPHNYTNFTDPDRLAKDFNVARTKNPGLTEMMHLYGIGDHGGGPTRAMLDMVARWQAPERVFSPSRFGGALDYFTRVAPTLASAAAPTWSYRALADGAPPLAPVPGKVAVPVWNDELYLEYTRGAFTSQANHKRNIRRAEDALGNAETWSALRWRMGGDYPAAPITDGWKALLFNENHDLAGGSAIGAVYRDAERDFAALFLAADHAQAEATDALSTGIDLSAVPSRDAVPILVWNAHAWSRSEVVATNILLPRRAEAIEIVDDQGHRAPTQTLADGRTAFLARDVPSLGYRTVYARAARGRPLPAGVTVATTPAAFTLRNARLSATIDRTSGCVTHLVDISTGFDAIADGGCGNQLQAFQDRPKAYDAWNIDAEALATMTPLPPPERIMLAETGPVRATVRIIRMLGASRIVQDLRLDADSGQLVVDSDVDWRARHVLLKAAVPLAAASARATFEIPFGTIDRPTTRTNRWDAAKFEVPALRWADLGDGAHGLSLINESKYGYDAVGNVLRLSLLRAPTDPDPDADQGRHRFAYALYPHAGDWRRGDIIRRARGFNDPLIVRQVPPHPGALPLVHSFVGVDRANVVITALKRSEDGRDLVLRFYETEGQSGRVTLRVPAGARSAVAANLLEQAEGAPLPITDGRLSLPISPYAIQTIRVRF